MRDGWQDRGMRMLQEADRVAGQRCAIAIKSIYELRTYTRKTFLKFTIILYKKYQNLGWVRFMLL